MRSSSKCADEARMLVFLWQLTTSARKFLSRSLVRLIVCDVDPSARVNKRAPKCHCYLPQRFLVVYERRKGAEINATTVVDALYGSIAYHVAKQTASATVSAQWADGVCRVDSTRLSRSVKSPRAGRLPTPRVCYSLPRCPSFTKHRRCAEPRFHWSTGHSTMVLRYIDADPDEGSGFLDCRTLTRIQNPVDTQPRWEDRQVPGRSCLQALWRLVRGHPLYVTRLLKPQCRRCAFGCN